MTREQCPAQPDRVPGLRRWVAFVQRHAGPTVAIHVVLTLGLGLFAARTLGFNVDPNALFSKDLRFQQAVREFERYFPVLTNSLLVVVEGDTPEATREAAVALVTALDARRDALVRAYLPAEDAFFEQYGLLYGSVDDLESFSDQMDVLQPVLAELAREPSLANLVDVIETGLEEERETGNGAAELAKVLDQIQRATVAVEAGETRGLSWESVLVASAGLEPRTRTLVVAEPVLDLERVLAAEHSIEVVRETALQLGLVPERGIEVRVTGYPALNHEEMLGLTRDTALAGVLSFFLVLIVLVRAFHSPALVAAAALTLLAGLVWSAAFAGATVRDLNPLSITFGVLVIGLGIDFMIHLGMQFTDAVANGDDVEGALDAAVGRTGGALVLCAATTGVGFLAFWPTPYRGVSDLGLAAAGGMLTILYQTLTLFPALIRLLVRERALARIRAADAPRDLPLRRFGRPGLVCGVAVLLLAAALPLLSRVDLDTNVIRMRNPTTESVEAFEDLLSARETTPWFLDALVPTLAEADAIAERIRDLPEVDRVFTLSDYVPDDQDDKIEILTDVALVLGLPEAAPHIDAPASEQAAALRTLLDTLVAHPVARDPALTTHIEALRSALERFLMRWEAGDEAAFQRLAAVLLDPIPAQLDRLRANLAVDVLARGDLPAGLVSRMVSAEGPARIQVYPENDLVEHETMVEFVEAVRPIWDDITGLPVNLVESARFTWAALVEALTFAVSAIAVLLLVLWRRPLDAVIVLAPLLLAVLLTQVSTVVLPVSFNFANVIVLPLLLGIGVDGAIHLVDRSRSIVGGAASLLGSTTARAVVYSAITTMVSFGSLALSAHRGVSSLGVLLVIGMLWTLAANLLLLPALLELRERATTRAKPATQPPVESVRP